MDIKEEDILKDQINEHWYYLSKSKAMKKMLDRLVGPFKLLDVGAGSGFFSKRLLQDDRFLESVCVDPNYDNEYQTHVNNKSIKFVKSAESDSYNMMLMMDVLEHVDDDQALLNDYVENLDDSGYVFITVPAFQFLWSSHDVFLEHKRRYTIDKVEEVVKSAGLTVIQSRYYFGFLFPLIAMIRLFKKALLNQNITTPRSDLKQYPPLVNKILSIIHSVERKTFFNVNRFFGLSVLCLCKK